MNYAQDHPSSPEVLEYLPFFVRRMTAVYPPAAFDFLDKVPEKQRTACAYQDFISTVSKDSGEVLKNCMPYLLESAYFRADLFEDKFQDWKRTDPVGAETWWKELKSSVSGETRKKLERYDKPQ